MTDKQLRRLYIKYRNSNPGKSREAARAGFKTFLKERDNNQ